MSCSCPDPALKSCAECRDWESARRSQRWLDRVANSGLPVPLQGLQFNRPFRHPASAGPAWTWGQGKSQGLCLRGPVGTGKTYLAAAATWLRLRRDPVLWVPVPTLMTELRSGHGSKAKARADKIIAGKGGIVLDDLSKANPSEYGKEILHAAIDNRYAAGAPLLVTSEIDLNRLSARLGDSIASRLAGYCRVVPVEGPDRRLQ